MNYQLLTIIQKNYICMEKTSIGYSAADYTRMIEDKSYPSEVNSFHQNEINEMWAHGRRMSAIKKLQDILEPKIGDKTLL